MRRGTRSMILILVIAIMLSSFTACSGGEKKQEGNTAAINDKVPEYMNAAGMPIAKQSVTLKAMVPRAAVQADYDTMFIWKEYEKLSNIHINWIQVPDENIDEKRNLAIASGELPDFFMKCAISLSDVQKYGGEGLFLKLDDFIKKYGPNFQKALVDYPNVNKGLRAVDGSIYSIPYIMTIMPTRVIGKLFINRKWLDAKGKKMPATTDELYDVLKALKTYDANGNGKEDEIPLAAPSFEQMRIALRGAWGLGNRGSSSGLIDFDAAAGKVRFWPTDPKYKDFLTYMNKLHLEGLIDPDVFTMNANKFLAYGPQNKVGSFIAINNNFVVGQKYENDYEGIPAAIKGPAGDQLWTALNSELWNPGSFVITKDNKYPELTMRWVDYLFSEEGIKLFFMGKEGETCKLGPDGNYVYVDEIAKNPNGLTFDQSVGRYFAWGGKGNPSIATPKYYSAVALLPVTNNATKNMLPYLPKECWPQFSYTNEELEQKTPIDQQLNTYVNQMTAEFVVGRKPFSDWDNYVKQLKTMGLDESLKIAQTAYERYQKNK